MCQEQRCRIKGNSLSSPQDLHTFIARFMDGFRLELVLQTDITLLLSDVSLLVTFLLEWWLRVM